MKHLFIAATLALLGAPVWASPEILPISGTGHLCYDEGSGKVTPASNLRNYGYSLWAATQWSGYFFAQETTELTLDWGDIDGPVAVGGLGFAEYTNSQADDGDLKVVLMVYGEENGWNSTGRVAIAGYLIENVPGSAHPAEEYWGNIWGLDILTPFVLDGSDLDGDELTDFGYAHWFETIPTPGALAGPALVYMDPNGLPARPPGVDGWFDIFLDPNLYSDPNLSDAIYDGTYSICNTFQFYFELFAPSCPNRGESGRYCLADIDGSFDCLVNLADLAECLSYYGMTTGATPLECDLDPYDPDGCDHGDGDVDLADLAELLGQYGDNCNWPQP